MSIERLASKKKTNSSRPLPHIVSRPRTTLETEKDGQESVICRPRTTRVEDFKTNEQELDQKITRENSVFGTSQDTAENQDV